MKKRIRNITVIVIIFLILCGFGINRIVVPAKEPESIKLEASKIPREVDRSAVERIFQLKRRDVAKLYGNPDTSGYYEGSIYNEYINDDIVFYYEDYDGQEEVTDSSKVTAISFGQGYSVFNVTVGMSPKEANKASGLMLEEVYAEDIDSYFLSCSIDEYEMEFWLDENKEKILGILIDIN